MNTTFQPEIRKYKNKNKNYIYEPSPFSKIPRIKRDCLRCGQPFKAIGRFNRVCEYCKDKNERFDLDDVYSNKPYNERNIHG